MATRVWVGNIGKYSIRLSTNCFSMLKLLDPMLPDLSMTSTMSILGEAMKEKNGCDLYVFHMYAHTC
jgi:hypothetical protein